MSHKSSSVPLAKSSLMSNKSSTTLPSRDTQESLICLSAELRLRVIRHLPYPAECALQRVDKHFLAFFQLRVPTNFFRRRRESERFSLCCMPNWQTVLLPCAGLPLLRVLSLPPIQRLSTGICTRSTPSPRRTPRPVTA